MKYYLIDYENVGPSGLHGHELTETENSVLSLFYSGNIAPPDGLYRLIKLKHSGKNALDFQIVTQLATIVNKDPFTRYFIISKDQGFLAAIEELKSIHPGLVIELRASIYDTFSLVEKDYFNYIPHADLKSATQIPCVSKNITDKRSTNVVAKFDSQQKRLQLDPTKFTVMLESMNCTKKEKKVVIACLKQSHSKDDLHLNLTKKLSHQKGVEVYRQLKSHLSTAV